MYLISRARMIGGACMIAVSLVWAAPANAQLKATVYAEGLTFPIAFVQDPTNPQIQYSVEQGGRIRVIQNGTVLPTAFLTFDTATEVKLGSEQGLLGLAFPPDYAASGRFFVNFTRQPEGNTVIARFNRSAANPLVANKASRKDLVFQGTPYIAQPYANHNGGTIVFGSDGFLYIGLGDGGAGNDPEQRAQNPNELLGKMLRIDVSYPGVEQNPNGYRIPADNPFLDNLPVTARPEIWAFGYRNPFKFSQDRVDRGGTGGWFIGDVGQSAREEVDFEPANTGGRNYGWPVREGTIPGPPMKTTAYPPLINPIYDYPRTGINGGVTVIGGVVYRGQKLAPEFVGRYFFADYVGDMGTGGKVFSLGLEYDGNGEAHVRMINGAPDVRNHMAELGNLAAITSLDMDAAGELYVTSPSGIVYRIDSTVGDTDRDGLLDTWETTFGLNPNSAAGPDGANGDPDGDGRTNAQELAAGTHPRGLAANTRYFAEGATSPSFFDTSFALANPSTTTDARVLLRFLKSDGTVVSQPITVEKRRRVTLDPKTLPDLATAAFSTILESDLLVIGSRTMTWANGQKYGSHTEAGIPAPAQKWVLAEGATHSDFDLFYLIENPHDVGVDVRITYLRPDGQQAEVKTYRVEKTSRLTIWVNNEEFPAGSGVLALASTDVSAVIESLDPLRGVIVERSMYQSKPGEPTFAAGHGGAGIPVPAGASAPTWYLAEGATGPFFDLYVLITNISSRDALIRARFLRSDGSVAVEKTYTIDANSRFSLWVDDADAALANTAVATVIQPLNGVPVFVERAMWWPGGPETWQEAHNSAGVTRTAPAWALSNGEVGPTADTFVLIANTGAVNGQVKVTLLLEGQSEVSQSLPILANSRLNVNVAQVFGASVAGGALFGIIVESEGGDLPLVVEDAVYLSPGGDRWSAGSNVVATPLR